MGPKMTTFLICLSRTAKYILFVSNLLILICAIAFMITAIVLKCRMPNLELGLNFIVNIITGLLIAVAILIGLIAFFGCCGAILKNTCLLAVYAAIMLFIFLIQMGLTIGAIIFVKNAKAWSTTLFKNILEPLYDNPNRGQLATLLSFHRNYKCCGYYGPTGPEVTDKVLQTCCKQLGVTCTVATAYSKGCTTLGFDYVYKMFGLGTIVKIVIAFATVFALVELFSALFAIYVIVSPVRNRTDGDAEETASPGVPAVG